MPRSHHLWIFAGTISLALLSGGQVLAENYRDAARHFTLQLPNGWRLMPAEALAHINAFLRERAAGSKVQYEAGFQLKDRQPADYPYILLQIRTGSTAGLNYDDLEKDLANTVRGGLKKMQGQLTDVIDNIALGDVLFDRSRNRIAMSVDSEVAEVGKVKVLSVGNIGSDGLVFLHCNARESEFPQYISTFNSITDSFRYDPGYQFVPAEGAPIGKGLLREALTGAGIAVAVVLVLKLWRRYRGSNREAI